jgi:hypothetical protein
MKSDVYINTLCSGIKNPSDLLGAHEMVQVLGQVAELPLLLVVHLDLLSLQKSESV